MSENSNQEITADTKLVTQNVTEAVAYKEGGLTNGKRIVIFFTVLVLLAFLSVLYALKQSSAPELVVEEVNAPVATSTLEVATSTEIAVIDESTKPVWYRAPKQVMNQNLLLPIQGSQDSLNYLEIGTYGNYKILLVNYQMMHDFVNLMFLVSGDSAMLLENHTTKYAYADFRFSPKVVVDNKIKFEELYPSSILTTNDGVELFSSYESRDGKVVPVTNYEIKSQSSFGQLKYGYNNVEIVGTTAWGNILRGYNLTEEGTAMYAYALELMGGLLVEYRAGLPKYVSVDRVLQVVWDDTGLKNEDMYRIDGLGSCGGGGPEVAVTKVATTDMSLAGRTVTGENAYVVSNPNHLLIDRVFDVTGGVVFEYSSEGTNERIITREEFIDLRGVVIVEEADGEQLVFTNGKYGPQAECGKPVVYLYPESEIDITVKVDAYVTKSEPLYSPETGWKATARPDGTLIVGEVEYKNLFWDGYGNGLYQKPETGVIVPTDTALAVMADNLRTIGFIESEIADFVEFWEDYMPEEEYTRITWLLTPEMEELAHLSIDPRPDTLIRAFVDYEGVTEPFEIVPQELPTTERHGYVATEWGGLLRKN
jgi:hypothetical protein